ncbi:aldehyde dehydrogenase [Leucobacter weissii]|uniref:Aldehyde dehydrogenase n=1 Tax=Leucobacter weissii TaxID=1983706 RepID=A0A939MPD5_9MICO|nr:aldehyde dehydrogenase [Leucobacter weissii]MBO1902151.1 aldehyde dehydrogenase [Leucobacter weissii]
MTNPNSASIPVIEQRSFISGEWATMVDSGRPLCDPNTGERRQAKLATAEEDVERALDAAWRLYDRVGAETVGLRARAELLLAAADELDRRQEEIAVQDSLNIGAPLSTTRIIASVLGDRVRSAVREAEELGESVELGSDERPVRLLRRALGPAVVVGPWNAPTFTTVGKVAAALLAGCPVLLKPSENAPSGCQIFAEILVAEIRRRDLPGALFQLIQGGSSVGALLTGDPRVAALSFTGGVSAGRAVASAATANLTAVQMELGSNNPAIVRYDADIETTAARLVQGMTRLNGQWCEAPGKILVHEAIHDELVAAMGEEIRRLRVGHSLGPGTEVGPLAFERHRDGLREEIGRLRSLGGRLISSERLPDLDGWFLAPGVIVGLDASAATQELFGPVATVHAVSDDAEALAHANAPGGGLDAYVFGTDTDAALRLAAQLRAGEVRVNGTFMSDLADGSRQSFWGTSGIGGHGPQYGVRFFLGDRVIGVDRDDLQL